MKFPTKTILVSMILSVIILMVVLSYGLYQMRIQSLKAQNLKTQVSSLEQIDSVAQTIRFLKNNSGDYLASLDKLTFSQTKIVSFIELVEGLGKQFGLEINTVSVTTDKTTVHIIFEADGGWARSIDFIHAIENLPFIVLIDDATMTTAQESVRGWRTHVELAIPFFDN